MLLLGKLVSYSFPLWFNVFLSNAFVFVMEGKIECVIFLSRCNAIFGNILVLVVYKKLAHASFMMQYNCCNALVFVISFTIEGKQVCVRFLSRCNVFLVIHFCLC